MTTYLCSATAANNSAAYQFLQRSAENWAMRLVRAAVLGSLFSLIFLQEYFPLIGGGGGGIPLRRCRRRLQEYRSADPAPRRTACGGSRLLTGEMVSIRGPY